MESTTLRQFLQSICYNSPWKYALFWKFQQHNQMLLRLDDGYCQTPHRRNSVEGISDNICYNGSHRFSSPKGESKSNDEYMGTDPVELALAYISSAQYTLADGIVGEVACSGNYWWASADDMSCGAFSAKPKCPDDWIFQFAAGIKTVLLVPVVPHGVLQLGSLETVAEDQAVVVNVKDKFFAFQELVGRFDPFSENMQFPAYSTSPMMCALVENVMPDLTMNGIESEQSNQILTSSILYDANVLSTCSTEEPEGQVPLCQSLSCNTIEMENMFKFPCIQEQFQPVFLPNDYNVGALGEFAINIVSSSDRGVTTQSPVDKDADNLGTFFSFPKDCELYKALGSTIMGSHIKSSCDTPLSAEEEYNCSNLISSGNISYNAEPSVWETSGPLMKDDGDHLLEFQLAGVDFSLDKNMSDSVSNIKSATTTLQSAFSKKHCQSERRTSVVNDAEPQSCVTSSVMDRVRRANDSSSPSASSFQSVMSALTGEENQKKGRHHTHPRKGSKLSNDSKRRSRTADNLKARPRDRQLIQDRLKELRDLVPDSVKCSIDGLLDRTIHHMLFLRSVTDQADKLRRLVHEEAAQGKNWKSANRKDSQKNGTSWAYDLGSEQQLCPIKVEDLECPGNMLIEMLCGDHGNFLDIADVIRRLELTILKGGIENHSGSTWARFIVEVPRGFHRLDIFWPLMQLLQ